MFRLIAAALIAASIAPAAALAQETYPTRPVTLVVPFPPGGVADLTARAIGPSLERALKQRIIVENKPGAGGAVGMAYVAGAKPDGYTLLMALSSISIIPEAERLYGKKPPYEMNQLAPIALVSADPTVLVVRAESPWKTAKEFIEDARKRPGKINYGSSGVYGTLHMAMAMLESAAGIQMWHVPYQGAGPAVAALLGGQIDALASGPSAVIGQVKAGKFRVLASWGDKRLASLPDVPTFRELGIDAEFYIWSGLFAPAGTPEPVMTTLRTAARAAVADPEFKAAMEKIETPIAYLDAPEFQKFWDRDAQRLGEAVRRIGKIDESKK
ncbi:MAG: tripartite tricarboxylate transporter substrate binding protein [Burkholderiales bacterium]|nr:tripartite tricarboxylate transporter substrate binding protein [Burkholderiales bacterium]